MGPARAARDSAPPDPARDAGDDAARRRTPRARRRAARAMPASGRRARWSCCTSAPAIRSGAGRRHSFAELAAALASGRRRAHDRHHVRARRRRTPPARSPTLARASSPGRRPRASCAAASSISPELRALVDRARALHRRRQRPAAHRGDDARRRWSRCSGRRCRSVRCRGAIRAVGADRVDAGPLPCRPCHQRACVPGDFRCLTRIPPDGGRGRRAALARRQRSTLMTTLTLTRGRAAPRDRARADRRRSPDRHSSPRLQFSIAAAQILLAVAVAAWLALLVIAPRAARGAARSSGRCSPMRR